MKVVDYGELSFLSATIVDYEKWAFHMRDRRLRGSLAR